jgi:cytochrome c oxidase subunit IV
MEFNDNYPAYEMMAHHSEEEGKKMRRSLWNVFWIMLIVTIVELVIGFMAPSMAWTGTFGLKFVFIGLTLLKAGFIVMSFMHLGHETKFMKYTVLLPYSVFILYAIFIVLTEGTYTGKPLNRTYIDNTFEKQQVQIEADKKSGANHSKGDDHKDHTSDEPAH